MPDLQARAAFLSVLLALATIGCGGGGSSTTGGPPGSGPQLLFLEPFISFPGSVWTTQGVLPLLDQAVGSPSPSLAASGGGATTVSAFSTTGGLDIYIRLRMPPDPSCSPTLQIGWEATITIPNDTGGRAGNLQVTRLTCPSGNATRIDYSRAGAPGTVMENLGQGSATGQFWEFQFRIFPNGDTQWLRDGAIQASSVSPIAQTNVRVQIFGGDKITTHFDEIRIFDM